MRNFIKNTKKDLEKLGIGKSKEEQPTEGARVIKVSRTKAVEDEVPQEKVQEEEKETTQAGIIIKYATDMVFEVIDEEGNKIPCKTLSEAEMLSRLIEIRLFLQG